jgi:tetratricopeptide (TPR) repeat protein
MSKSHVLRFVGVILATTIAIAAASERKSSSEAKPSLIAGLGDLHRPVSTSNKQAQAFFDQGLKLVYGFNHDQARLCFAHAAELDPKLAIAWWGVALTLGPNYNLPADPEREKQAFDAIRRAVSLKQYASEPERAYIDALVTRYSGDPKADLHALDVAYANAMRELSARFPDDLDAATFYAESLMNLHPWQLWLPDGKPNENTDELMRALESVLKRDPNHLGANHYYIHAVEASPNPERALPSAARLEKLAPAAGHLVHMPSHIYSRVGDHIASAHANTVAAASDQKFLQTTHQQGVYPLMYYSHNLHFLAYASCMDGNFEEAKRAADKLVANVCPQLKKMAMLEGFVPTPLFVLITFERWPDILKVPPPDDSLVYTAANWHFARALAFAATAKQADAEKEANEFHASIAKLPPDASFDPLNPVAKIAAVQDGLLIAALARGRGDSHAAIDALTKAVAAEDGLNYSEPPSWYPPVRPMLGRALLEAQQLPDAERVFREALEKSARYFRALAGLRDALKAQGKEYEATKVAEQLREATKSIDAISVAARGR